MMKRYIYAMSRSRRDVGAALEQGCDELIMHLIKLRVFPDADAVFHWRQEVAEKLHRCDTFKVSHKLPSVKFILQNTYQVHEGRIDRYIHIVSVDYAEDMHSFDKDVLKQDIYDYFEWLANELSQYGRVAYQDIYTKLEELGF